MPSSVWLRTALKTLILTHTLINRDPSGPFKSRDPVREVVFSFFDSPNVQEEIASTTPILTLDQVRMPESDLVFAEADQHDSSNTPQSHSDVIDAMNTLVELCLEISKYALTGDRSIHLDPVVSTSLISTASNLINGAKLISETLSSDEERQELASFSAAVAQATACASMAMHAVDPEKLTQSTCGFFKDRTDGCLELGLISEVMASTIHKRCRKLQ